MSKRVLREKEAKLAAEDGDADGKAEGPIGYRSASLPAQCINIIIYYVSLLILVSLGPWWTVLFGAHFPCRCAS